MVNFEYYAPTKVVFGKDTEAQVGQLAKAYGATKVLVHFGGGSVQRSGLLDRVLAALDEAGVPHVELGGVVPNPRISKVYEGIRLCREEGVDFLLAVGGGSVIDSCKAIGYGLYYDGDVWDLYEGLAAPKAHHPCRRQRGQQFLRHHQRGWLEEAGPGQRPVPPPVRHHEPRAHLHPAPLPDGQRLRGHHVPHH